MTLLELSGLTLRTTDGTTLVDDLSLTLARGERLGLIGESGSGKSLTALAVLGLLPEGITATGSIELAGTQIVGAREDRLTRMRGRDAAVVFQEPLTALDPLMRAGRQLADEVVAGAGLVLRHQLVHLIPGGVGPAGYIAGVGLDPTAMLGAVGTHGFDDHMVGVDVRRQVTPSVTGLYDRIDGVRDHRQPTPEMIRRYVVGHAVRGDTGLLGSQTVAAHRAFDLVDA